MPWSKMSDVPANIRKLDGVSLTLSQANYIASVADTLKEVGHIDDSVYTFAVLQFKNNFQIHNGSWKLGEAKDGSFALVEKQADGSYWITAVSTADVMDKEGETFGIEAIDYDLSQANKHKDYPEFRVFHSKHLGIGRVEKMSRVGIFAVDEGKSYTDPFSLQVCEKMLAPNDGVYKCSRGFRVVEASGRCPDCDTNLIVKEDYFYGFTCPICMSTRSRYKELGGVRYRKARTFDVTITDIPCVPMTGAKAIKLPVEDGIMTKEELKKRLSKAGISAEVIDQRLESITDDEMKHFDERPFAEVLKEFAPDATKEAVSEGQVFVLDPEVLADFTAIVRKEVQDAINGISIEIPDSDIELKEIPGLIALAEEVAELKEMVSALLRSDDQRLKELVDGAPRSGKLRIHRAVYKTGKTGKTAPDEEDVDEEDADEELTEEEKAALKKNGAKEMPPYLRKLLAMKEDDEGDGVIIRGADGGTAKSMSEFVTGGGK